MNSKGDMRVAALLAELKKLGSAKHRAEMARYGINVDSAFGVSIYELRPIARRLGTDHALALALWATGNHEARLLACFVDDPALVTPKQLEAWARRDEEWVKRGGFALMAGLAVHDKAAADRDFVRLLPLIEAGAFDDRNFVKKAVNWALRNVGKRGGDAVVRAARWVATDALRELGSDKVQARIARK